MTANAERLVGSAIFPSHQQRSDFIEGKTNAKIYEVGSKKPPSLSSGDIVAGYCTPSGITNSFDGYNHGIPKTINILYNAFTQKREGEGIVIENCTKEDYIFNKLRVAHPTGRATSMTLSGTSYYDTNKHVWVDTQEIYFSLEEGYIRQLLDDGLITNNTKGRLWIQRKNGKTTILMENNTDRPDGTIDITENEDLLLRLYRELDFIYAIKEDNSLIVDAGDFRYELETPNAKELSAERILNAAKEIDPQNPFLYRAQVKKLSQIQ